MWCSHNANGVLQGSALDSAQAQVTYPIPYSSYPSLVPGSHQSGVKETQEQSSRKSSISSWLAVNSFPAPWKPPAASHCTVKSPIGAVLIAARAVGALKLSASGSWAYRELKPPALSVSLISALSWRPPTPHLEETAEEEAYAFAPDSAELQVDLFFRDSILKSACLPFHYGDYISRPLQQSGSFL